MLSGYPGTRVSGGPGSGPLKSRVTRRRARVRPPEFGGVPVRGGYPAGGIPTAVVPANAGTHAEHLYFLHLPLIDSYQLFKTSMDWTTFFHYKLP